MRVKIEKPTRFKPKQYMDVTNNVVTFDWEYAFNDKHFDLIDMFEDMKVTVFISSKVTLNKKSKLSYLPHFWSCCRFESCIVC